MVNQSKLFSFKIKRQAKTVFPSDIERTVVKISRKCHNYQAQPVQSTKTKKRPGANSDRTNVIHEAIDIQTHKEYDRGSNHFGTVSFTVRVQYVFRVFKCVLSVITKTRLLNISPPKTESFQIKILIFSYFCSKHRLLVLVRTASARRF